MPDHLYLEANPIVSWADSQAGNPTARDAAVGAEVIRLIAGPAITATSEIALLEVHSTICDHWRDSGRPDHGDAWAKQAFLELRKWIAMGDLQMLPTPPRLAEMAMTYVEMVTGRLGRQLRAWDAAHLVMASNWSRELGDVVTMVTSDGDFFSLLPLLPEFNAYVRLHNPAP